MKYDEFINQVQRRAGLESHEKAVQATEATFETLGERLIRSERENLSAQLPLELKNCLQKRIDSELFLLEEFYNRVSSRADMGYPDAVKLTKVVLEVLKEAVSPGEIGDILSVLPEDFGELFGAKPEGPLSPSSS
jgi:uncharacterized protein (DUF2267 family)